MRESLERYPSWKESLAPRMVLGLWHPKFVGPAISILRPLRRCFIGIHLSLAQAPVFWETCDAFSIAFPVLTVGEGPAFRAKCKEAGKKLYAWTMNKQEEWALGVEWGLDVIMTDTPGAYLGFRKRMQGVWLSAWLCCCMIVHPFFCRLVFRIGYACASCRSMVCVEGLQVIFVSSAARSFFPSLTLDGVF